MTPLPVFNRKPGSAGIPKKRLLAILGTGVLVYLCMNAFLTDYDASACDWGKYDKSPACRQASKDALKIMARDLEDVEDGLQKYEICKFKTFGSGFGGMYFVSIPTPHLTSNVLTLQPTPPNAAHDLCDHPPPKSKPCTFYSFGIDNDYSFDTALDESWQCNGILLDPTVNHSSTPGPRLNFFRIGATLLSSSDLGGSGSTMRGTVASEWLTTSVPSLKKFLGHRKIDILKMDCEGCEYSLARDIAREDPTFFKNVDQFAVEVHISKNWIKTSTHVHYLGLLYHMLQHYGFRLMHSEITPCHPSDEALGCPRELLDAGYKCGPYMMCHNYLFSKSSA
ncbi:Methyltransferase-like protein 24 [Rhizophlyctis rosea]|uniref:Methyltransferase-like protein 24 n=1 Tax=Rhizophlyctis rosea TaxID=64517 RepID=A0AAD5X8L4_9FUNG|nr:Methyltransferase-like protein 24 [Rhizophlyctis rosea]